MGNEPTDLSAVPSPVAPPVPEPVSEPVSEPWYRQFWPWLLIAIPLTTVVAGTLTIWVASREPVALVHDDYYKEGLTVNQDLARDRQAARWHLQATLTIDANNGMLYGQIDGDTAISDLSIRFIHPASSRYDQVANIPVSDDGQFALPLPSNGKRWYIELRGNDEPNWRLQGPVVIAHNATVHLPGEDAAPAEPAEPAERQQDSASEPHSAR